MMLELIEQKIAEADAQLEECIRFALEKPHMLRELHRVWLTPERESFIAKHGPAAWDALGRCLLVATAHVCLHDLERAAKNVQVRSESE